MEYFNFEQLKLYKEVKDQPYRSKSPQASLYKSTRDKLRYLVTLFAKKDEPLDFVYSVRPNAQAGRGKINFREYVLIGFAPSRNSIGDDLFIKFEINNLFGDHPVFAINIHVNFKKGTSRFHDRGEEIYNDTYTSFPIDDSFPDNWNDLVDLLFEHYLKLKEQYDVIVNDNISTLFSLYNDYLENRVNNLKEIKQGTASSYLQTAKERIPELWNEFYTTDFSSFTFSRVNLENLHQISVRKNFSGVSSFQPFSFELLRDFSDKKNPALNQILYGPPGTGKTFRTKQIAVQIIDGEVPDTRQEINERYKVLVREGRVKFTTFHQSLSYEDFIEGIKPTLNEKDEVIYEIQDGIFKQLSHEASRKNKSNIDEAFEKMISAMNDSEEEYFPITTSSGTLFHISPNRNGNLNLFTSDDKKRLGALTKKRLKNHFELGYSNYWKSYQGAILAYLQENYDLTLISNSHKNYVLIIDEINRGNVASIFGELITLLERDKRVGQNEALDVVLPYSKEAFSLPSNLFIVGTMNTTDKSIEALDAALRRRFSFTEVNYDASTLFNHQIGEIELEKLVTTINDRIEYLIDKDHKIGHALFIGLENIDQLKLVFSKKVIPLLEDYFFGDLTKVGLILGSDFIQEKNSEEFSVLHPSFDSDRANEKVLFEITDPIEWDKDSFKSVYAYEE